MQTSNSVTGDNNIALIDCRPRDEFARGHIKNATHLPASQLFMRMHELPKRNQALTLCGRQEDLQEAVHFLKERGHTISKTIEWSDTLAEQLIAQHQFSTGTQSPTLWQAAPIFRYFVETVMPQHRITAGVGLDVACGAGRDLIYLAQHGWQMTGIDRSADSLQRLTQLATDHELNIAARQIDLETEADPFTDWQKQSIDLICVARYLHRPLFPHFKRLLKPGGILIYQTFMEGCEKTAVGRPRNPAFLLKPNELAEHFAGADILLDRVETLEDGRPISAFIARIPTE